MGKGVLNLENVIEREDRMVGRLNNEAMRFVNGFPIWVYGVLYSMCYQ